MLIVSLMACARAARTSCAGAPSACGTSSRLGLITARVSSPAILQSSRRSTHSSATRTSAGVRAAKASLVAALRGSGRESDVRVKVATATRGGVELGFC